MAKILSVTQAVLLGTRAIALSTPFDDNEPEFMALELAVITVLHLLIHRQKERLLNVNIPLHSAGVRWTRQSVRQYDGAIIPDKDPKGREHFWFTVTPPKRLTTSETDSQLPKPPEEGKACLKRWSNTTRCPPLIGVWSSPFREILGVSSDAGDQFTCRGVVQFDVRRAVGPARNQNELASVGIESPFFYEALPTPDRCQNFTLSAQNQRSIRTHRIGAINRDFRSIDRPAYSPVRCHAGQRTVALGSPKILGAVRIGNLDIANGRVIGVCCTCHQNLRRNRLFRTLGAFLIGGKKRSCCCSSGREEKMEDKAHGYLSSTRFSLGMRKFQISAK